MTVAAPARPVLLPAEVVDELVSVVAACLDNVAVHVGPEAPAWVLLEELPDRLSLSVRDEGPGIPEGRLTRPPGRDAWASPSPSGAGSPTSAARPTWSPVRSAPSGSSPCRGRDTAGPEAGRTVGG